MSYKQWYVYILASQKHGTPYTGFTNNLIKRIWEHKQDLTESFTKQYQVHTLVYFEVCDTAMTAITREKQLKNWRRDWKIMLIDKDNPDWVDLYPNLVK